MSKIKVSELFYSLQGEGRYTGVPSVFLRTFGCNFKCQGFNMPKGEKSTEADEVALIAKSFNSINDVPLVKTGCDSPISWHPGFKHLSPLLNVDDIAEHIISLLPNKHWVREHLVITGGEPLLGWQRNYPELLSHPKMTLLSELTFETNGTQPIQDDFAEFLQEWTSSRHKESLTFSVSAKLSCSGEARDAAIKPEVVRQYQDLGHTYLKLVVATEDDVKEAIEVVGIYRDHGFKGNVYLMPVGGTTESYYLNREQVANLALTNGLCYSDRLHIVLYGNAWAT